MPKAKDPTNPCGDMTIAYFSTLRGFANNGSMGEETKGEDVVYYGFTTRTPKAVFEEKGPQACLDEEMDKVRRAPPPEGGSWTVPKKLPCRIRSLSIGAPVPMTASSTCS